MVQNTALQLGILPLLLKARENVNDNNLLESQLSLFHNSLKESYDEISQHMSPEEQAKYANLIDKPTNSNQDTTHLVEVTLPEVMETITIDYTKETTVLDILERVATIQQYLHGDELSYEILTNLFSYGVFIEDLDAGEGCYYTGQCVRSHSQRISDYQHCVQINDNNDDDDNNNNNNNNNHNKLNIRIDLLPWNVNINIANIIPKDPSLPVFLCISVCPRSKIGTVIKDLQEKHNLNQVDYGFYFPSNESWLDPLKSWDFYPAIQGFRGNAISFIPKYKPLRVRFDKEVCEIDCFDLTISIETLKEFLFSKFKKIHKDQINFNDYGVFLFPLPTSDDCSARTCSIAEENGWKKEEQYPGTFLLLPSKTFFEATKKYPKRNFTLTLAKIPKSLHIGLRIDGMEEKDDTLLAYFDYPVRNLITVVRTIFQIDASMHCSLAIQSDSRYVPLRRQSSLTVSSIPSQHKTQNTLCKQLTLSHPLHS